MLVREAGVERRVTRRGAVVLSLLAKALKGDVRAAALLLAAEQRADLARPDAPGDALSTDEAAVFEAFEARMRQGLRREEASPEASGTEPAAP